MPAPRFYLRMSVGVLYAQSIASLAAAAPPFSRAPIDEHREPAARTVVAPRLDLHLPRVASDLAIHDSVTASATAAPDRVRTAMGAGELGSQPAWRGDAPQLAETTRLQELAHGVRRNGLPLARLWQGRGAQLSLGLNPKGKPGLWFIKQLQ